jgi:membrane protease YdiL (CAAX protease family)
LAAGLELGLLVLASIWAWGGRLDLREALAFPPTAWMWFLVGVAVMVAANGLLLWGGQVLGWKQPRRWVRELLLPLFGDLEAVDIVLLSAAAGFCEEVLFRGVMQAVWGWAIASLVFGALHFPGLRYWGFALWATATGGWLGWLYLRSGCLWVPILTHALYDFLALSYIRWVEGPRWRAVAEMNPEGREEEIS